MNDQMFIHITGDEDDINDDDRLIIEIDEVTKMWIAEASSPC
jgi:hypothetical protein